VSNKTQIKRTISRILSPVPAPVPSVKPAPAPVPPKYTDKIITCVGCGASFDWTWGDQLYYQKKGMVNPPKWCADCRKKRREYFLAHPEKDNRNK
jgi:hypothetical protein